MLIKGRNQIAGVGDWGSLSLHRLYALALKLKYAHTHKYILYFHASLDL